jgi:hypothetical protein
MNLERYALAGGLPAKLRELALGGSDAINEMFKSEEPGETEFLKDYLDDLVVQMVVEPSLKGVDMDDLPPADYRWLVSVAMGDEDRDGEGRRLWGREPLSTFRVFRDEHGCTTDCAGCKRLVDALSAD